MDKIVRVREMYNWFLSNPGGTDREFVSEVMRRHYVSKVTAYSDLVGSVSQSVSEVSSLMLVGLR